MSTQRLEIILQAVEGALLPAADQVTPDMPAGNRVAECPVPLNILIETSRSGCHMEFVPAVVAVVVIPLPIPLSIAEHCALHLRIMEQMAWKKLHVKCRTSKWPANGQAFFQ
jgi:hypothetical protein